MKKSLLAMLVLTLILTLSITDGTALAGSTIDQEPKQIELIESVQEFNTPQTLESSEPTFVGKLSDNGYYNEKTGEIDKEKLKEALIEFIKENPRFEHLLENLDSLVENIIGESAKTTASDVGIQAVVIDQGFRSGHPYVTRSTNMVTYSEIWLVENNYRSAVPIKVGSTRSRTTTATLGFSGSSLIKDLFKFNGTYSESQTATVTVGADVPAWTVWGYRPYIKWTNDEWQGTYYFTHLDTNTGRIYDVTREERGNNRRLTQKSNEYWSQVNTAKNPNAVTPDPPDRQPL